jgi:hypothetical protein
MHAWQIVLALGGIFALWIFIKGRSKRKQYGISIVSRFEFLDSLEDHTRRH